MKLFFATYAFFIGSYCDSVADTLYVSTSVSIQYIISGASSGDWIILEPGSHQGPIIPYGRELTIGSRFLLDGDTSWISETVVQSLDIGEDSSSAAIYSYDEADGELRGLTLRGGSGTLNDRYNIAVGGCVYIDRANVTIQNCRLTGGETLVGSGAFVTGTPWLRDARLQIFDSLIDSCHAEEWGGGIYADHCTLTVERCILRDLSCGMATAGLDAGTSFVVLDSLVVTHCFGGYGGIALSTVWGSVTACEFYDNATPATGFCNDLSVQDFWGTIEKCIFRDTEAPWPSVFIGGPNGQTEFIGNVLENNTTSVVTGTLIMNNQNDNVVSHNIFRNNHNVQGGAIYAFSDADALVEFNTFIGNSSGNPEKGSLLQSNTRGQPRLTNNIIIGNIGNCIAGMPEYPLILDARNNWWGHESGPYHAEQNPLGLGDTLVGDSVLFVPWLSAPPDTTQPAAIRPEQNRPLVGTWDLQAVFPNPFNNAFTLSLAGFAGNTFQIALHNLLGQRVASLHSGPALGGLFSFAVSSELSSGVYFLVAQDDRARESIKVVLLK